MAAPLSPHIAIIGAGCAGLAAAAKLTQHGLTVTLFEAAPQLGGRARGIRYKGVDLDNGQHILLGAYSETLSLLALSEADLNKNLQRMPLSMHMQDLNSHNALHLSTCNNLPAPLHLLAGLLSAKGLSRVDKWLAIRTMTNLHVHKFKLKADIALADFLIQQKQSKYLIQFFWEPLCLAALNTPLNLASSQVFLNVLRDSFARKKSDSDMLLAKVDLTKLIAEPVSAYIKKHGGNIQLATVTKIQAKDSGYRLTSNLGDADFSHVIIAVAPHQLDKVAPNEVAHLAKHFVYQPITTVYLQYPKQTILPQAMQGLVSSLSQWAFDRGQICGQDGLIAVVISAEGKHQNMTQSALAESVIAELKQAFPQLPTPLWHKVITEKRATFSCNASLHRPTNKTTLANLYLAGDYTQGDYPATIEGAVRSGVQCANLILNALKARP